MKNTLKKGIIVAFVTLMLAGCGSIPKLKDGTELIVKMDGMNITVTDFYQTLKDNYGTYALVNSIDTTLLNKVYPTTDELTKKVDAQVLTLKNQFGSDFENAISYYYGVSTEKQLSDYILMSFKRQLASNDYAATLIKDNDIKKYYDEKSVGDIKASHILIKSDAADTATDAEKAKAEEEALKIAKSIINKLDAGEDFAALAKKYSDDSSASDGGNLGYFNRGEMVAAFEDAAVALKVGEYSKTPVKTTYGYHIILKTDQKEKPKYDDVKDKIKTTLISQKVANTSNINAFAMEWLREKHNLEIFDSELKVKYDHYMNQQKTATSNTTTNS